MSRLRVPYRIAAWLALAGMALNAFLPLVAIAKPEVHDISAEICSASGHRHHGSAPAKAPGQSVHWSHCTLCTFHASWSAALPPAPHPGVVPASTVEPRPECCATRPADTALDLATPPRAPPLLS